MLGKRTRNLQLCIALPIAVLFAGAIDAAGRDARTESAAQAQIVRNAAPDTVRPAFRISAQPVMKVGGLNDDARYELTLVSATSLNSKGHLFISDGERSGIREFDPAGKFVRLVGRGGQGPGEFPDGASRIAVMPGDSILAYDESARRLMLFDPSGKYLAMTVAVARATCCLRDKSFLMAPSRPMTPLGDARTNVDYLLGDMSQPQAVGKQILSLIGDEPSQREPPRTGQNFIAMYPNPFGHKSQIVVTWDAIVFSDGGNFGFDVYSKSGTLIRRVLSEFKPVPISNRDVQAVKRDYVTTTRPELTAVRGAMFEKFRIPPTYQAHGRIRAEPGGSVWLQHYSGGDTINGWWTSFDASGRMTGSVKVPAGRSVAGFGFGHILLLASNRDEGTVTIFVHRLERTGSRE